MMARQGRILVIRGGAIGDFILTVPVLTALRQQFPDVHLEVLGYPHITSLALAAGVVDEVHPIEAKGLAGFFARGGELDPAVADYFADFDIILSYLFDPDGIFQTNVALCTPSQFIQGPHRPDETLAMHATETYLQPLERLAIFDADRVPVLRMPSPSTQTDRLALHPGSGSEAKNWPEAKWRGLIERLIEETDAPLLIVGGEAEGDRLDRLTFGLDQQRVSMARSLALPDLAGLLQGCVGFVGHDSGITHLAAACAVPCVALWGNTAAPIWRPQGDHVVVLQSPEGLSRLAADRVFEEVLKLIIGPSG
jgi:heptosyltransferase-2